MVNVIGCLVISLKLPKNTVKIWSEVVHERTLATANCHLTVLPQDTQNI